MVHFGLVTRGYNIAHDSHLEETEYTGNISIRIPVFSEQGITGFIQTWQNQIPWHFPDTNPNFPDISVCHQRNLVLFKPLSIATVYSSFFQFWVIILNLSKFLLKLFSMSIVNYYVFDKEIYRLSHYYMLKTAVFFLKFGCWPLNLTSSTATLNATCI